MFLSTETPLQPLSIFIVTLSHNYFVQLHVFPRISNNTILKNKEVLSVEETQKKYCTLQWLSILHYFTMFLTQWDIPTKVTASEGLVKDQYLNSSTTGTWNVFMKWIKEWGNSLPNYICQCRWTNPVIFLLLIRRGDSFRKFSGQSISCNVYVHRIAISNDSTKDHYQKNYTDINCNLMFQNYLTTKAAMKIL